ncbi:hypothetical protein [Synoicihabitans lomoniglobus]|uniref:Chorismatase FkbO/Hyg5-like N-terminal domain-containing protein n=1 Tax=Synoicihabitans lomoniglobus TaxID=2909285 RepID=A0AAE9ZXN6_9BACT|nr:hypothetical protein [Opitutaceae bacterium LMO-M01]WED64463.1 hypothetical protein PXH66_19155 [Opitutaceae bacterium LMO-M01]
MATNFNASDSRPLTMRTTETDAFRVLVGANRVGSFNTGIATWDGPADEWLLPQARAAGRSGGFTLFADDHWLVGGARVDIASRYEQTTQRVYTDLLAAAHGWNLARIWNYVPEINEAGPDGLEHYRAFSRGRSIAFEQHFGPDFASKVSSASAVGCPSDHLTVVFAATRAPTRHLENPLQVPAYHYPSTYGPRAPSFARATIVDGERRMLFISGTAAVRGHQTIAPGDTMGQLDCTLENLAEITRAADHVATAAQARHFKVYLRHPTDLHAVRTELTKRLLRSTDTVSYLHADICRDHLNVEIEVTLGDSPFARQSA